MSIRPLCPCCQPARVTRYCGVTLMEIDPRARRIDCLAVSVAQLTEDEREFCRAAFGQPPIGLPIDDSFIEGITMPYIPPLLRVPGEPAVQAPPPCQPGPAMDAYELALRWWASEQTQRREWAS